MSRAAIALIGIFCIAGPSSSAIAENSIEMDEFEKVRLFSDVQKLAEIRSHEPFQPRASLPESLARLSYDQYRNIGYKPEEGVWWEDALPFSLETFHRGFVQRDRVSLYLIEDDETVEVPFSQENFSYGPTVGKLDGVGDAGHAGVKVIGRNPLLSQPEEVLTFLGSSYFRARSAETVYGTSARGLAVDVALPKDEEFPVFRHFWISKPKKEDTGLTIFGLLDSESVSGAYQFRLTPGAIETRIEVVATLYFRKLPEKVGIAPLTSMWMWGDGLSGPPLDSRPAVHDADGMLLQTEDQRWIWRPFARQSYPSVTRFAVTGIRGFGLLQRNRSFYHFDDHNALYHKRPSIWIEPKVTWSGGSVELLELPGAHEGVDNIAAYWVPEELPQIGKPIDLAYDVSVFPGDHASESYVGRVTNLQIDRGESSIALTARLNGKALQDISVEQSNLAVQLLRGKLLSKRIEKTETNDFLVSVEFQPTEKAPIEITLELHADGQLISEQLKYLCPEKEPQFVYPAVYTRIE